jgi:hypothetical protein
VGVGDALADDDVPPEGEVDEVGVEVTGVVVGGFVVGAFVVGATVVGVAVGRVDLVAVDVGTLLTLVLGVLVLAGVDPSDPVAGVPPVVAACEGPTVLPTRLGGPPPEVSVSAITAAMPQTATPAPPAMRPRRVKGKGPARSVSGSGSG